MDERQKAFKELISLFEKQGYLTIDDIMDVSEDYELPIQDVDWLSKAIAIRHILIVENIQKTIGQEEPKQASPKEQTKEKEIIQRPKESLGVQNTPEKKPIQNSNIRKTVILNPKKSKKIDDPLRARFERTYKQIVERDVWLESFTDALREITPPQTGEQDKLLQQLEKDYEYDDEEERGLAIKRLIEMHVRDAAKAALHFSKIYDMDINEMLELACFELTSLACEEPRKLTENFPTTFYNRMRQNIRRNFDTQTCYPARKKEACSVLKSLIQKNEWIYSEGFLLTSEGVNWVMLELNCTEQEAQEYIQGVLTTLPYEEISSYEEAYIRSIDGVRKEIPEAVYYKLTIDQIADSFEICSYEQLKQVLGETLGQLSEREQKVIRLRYGTDDNRARTLEEVGREFNLTRERIRQIEKKAMNKLTAKECLAKLIDFYES